VTQGVSPAQQAALEQLAQIVPPTTYLAGGVAIALRLHHRRSKDLDLFSPSADPAIYAESISSTHTGIRILSQSEGTLYLEVSGVPASWIRYRYPLLAPPERLQAVPISVASLDDLMCMKLAAIAGRGAARDFWDLHEILTRRSVTLTTALEAFHSKYPSHDRGHVVKALVYFADAEQAPLPEGLGDEHWRRMTRDFERWVGAL
jgi:hypothetical protein